MKVAVLEGDIQRTIRGSESEIRRWISDGDKRFASCTHRWCICSHACGKVSLGLNAWTLGDAYSEGRGQAADARGSKYGLVPVFLAFLRGEGWRLGLLESPFFCILRLFNSSLYSASFPLISSALSCKKKRNSHILFISSFILM